VTDQPSDEPPEPGATGEAADPIAVPAVDDAGHKVQRRAFLRQLTGDAVTTTGRLAGLSTALRRSVVAAGAAAVGVPDPPGEEEPASGIAPMPAAVEPPAVPAIPPAPAPQAPDASSLLSPRQHEVLEHGTTAILGVNDGSGAPHLTSSIFHWDGTVLRLPSELFSARVARIDADPRVSVLVELGPDAWVAVTGVADVVSGDAVESEMLTILRKNLPDEEAERVWSAMSSTGDRVVIRIRPTRFVWRLP
jgi:hypothetical protein